MAVAGFFFISQDSMLWAETIDDREREVIEALFFGTGPLGAGACPAYQRWAGFPRGSHIKVMVSTTVSEDKRDQIRKALDQVSEATRGAISVSFSLTDEPEPEAEAFHVVSMTHANPTLFGCVSGVGCTIHDWQKPGIFKSSRAIQPEGQTPQAYAHDVVGHGILGMCHIQAEGIGGADQSLMSGGEGVYSGQISGQLTQLDLAALQAVYASSLSPGATRNDFIRAALIDP